MRFRAGPAALTRPARSVQSTYVVDTQPGPNEPNPNEPNPNEPSPIEPSPIEPNPIEPPRPDSTPEEFPFTEPKHFPIHPDIPEQPIHEPTPERPIA